MIEVSVLTRSGHRIASSCAIMPPIEAPTTWASRDAENIQQSDRVGAMSLSR